MSAGVWALVGSLFFAAAILGASAMLVLELRGKLPA